MDDNMTNKDETAFGSSEYYKKLYDDFPEDVAEMLIGTHPLMKKEVSDELTNSIKVKSNRRGAKKQNQEEPEEAESASKDPIEEEPEEEEITDYVGDITNYTKGLATPSSKRHREVEPEPAAEEPEEPMSEADITAEKVARMLGGVEVEPVDEEELEEIEEREERPRKKNRKEQPPKKRKRQPVEERNLELSNIDRQADLNEIFREDDDYYDEKHSGNSVARIIIIIAAIVVLAFFVYKVASLSGQVSKLNEQVESYKTMETEYESLKLEKLSLEDQVKDLQAQLNGGTEPGSENAEGGSGTTTPASGNPSTPSAGSTTYTVQAGDTFWGIATKMYGNGSYYDRILKANGLTENDKIKEGMTLTIPAA